MTKKYIREFDGIEKEFSTKEKKIQKVISDIRAILRKLPPDVRPHVYSFFLAHEKEI